MKFRMVVSMVAVFVVVLLFSAVGASFTPVQAPPVQPSFIRADYPAQLDPFPMVVADFNGDGKLDLAAANMSSSSVSILIGRGDGTFQGGPDIPLAPYGWPVTMAPGDFNNDGKMDLVVGGDKAMILLGNGDGTFSSPSSYWGRRAPTCVVTGDFNSDGNIDVVMNDWYSAYISFGNGDGTFQPAVDLQIDSWCPWIVAADFNRDGNLDLGITRSDGRSSGGVSILLGAGDGTFIRAGDFPSGGDASAQAAAGDLDGDSIPDLVIANWSAVTISVLPGKGDGSFGHLIDYPLMSSPRGVATADFDGDGRLDVAVIGQKGTLSIFMSGGDGIFQPRVDLPVEKVEHYGILAADLNNDAKPDLIVSNLSPMNSVSVLINTLAGSKPPSALCRSVTVPAGPNCKASAQIDAGSVSLEPTTLVSTSQNPPGPYALGRTDTTLTVTDKSGLSSQCSATVTVVDSTAPTITVLSADPGVLWPVSGKMIPVKFTVAASDSCSAPVTCKIASISSSEPVGPKGDWVVTGDLTANLRAERLGTGTGREYTITLQCTDSVGNMAAKDVLVVVPHDQAK